MITTVLNRFAAEEAEASGFGALGFDAKAFLIQFVTFLLVFFLLKKYVFGRIVALLEKRRLTIEEGVKLTAKMSEEKAKLDREIAEIHASARKEATELLADTQAQASEIIKEAEATAGKRAEGIVEEARKKIDEETKRARRDLEKELVELVIQATEAVSGEKLDAKKDATLITNSLKGQA